ncbi:MAG: hypothetical protein JXA91_03220 [Candidatus Thermoplasmatota archaeon]|nr:hypothetical protein [Candidatus Thermoplasmatota archaeon]
MRKYAKVVVILLILLLIATSATMSVEIDKNDLGDASYFDIPEVEWSNTFGGKNREIASSIIPLENGGYILLGNTYSYGNGSCDFWVLKIDDNGQHIWNKTYGGKNDDLAVSIIPAHDGGYLIVGNTESSEGDDDIWLVKIDEDGMESWNESYKWSGNEFPFEILLSKNGYLILGYLSSTKSLLFEVDYYGSLLWDTAFNGLCYSIEKSNDGGYILVGEESHNAIVIKIHENIDLQWKKTFGEVGCYKCFYSIEKTMDDNWAITGEVYDSSGDDCDIWFAKINESGDLLIDKRIDGPFRFARGLDIKVTLDNGYIIAGGSAAVPPNYMFLIRTDSLGDKLWEKTLDGWIVYTFNNVVRPTKDGGYIATGTTEYMLYPIGDPNIFLTKFSSENLDLESPNIQILKPEDGLYINNKKIFEGQSTLVLGSINISCDVTDEETGVASVEIYIDDELKTIRENPPYSWMWNEQVFGQYNIKIVAYDYAGNKDTIEKTVFKFF